MCLKGYPERNFFTIRYIPSSDMRRIVLLPSWETSRGAVLEREIAKELNLDIYIYKGNGVIEKEQQ